MPRHRDNGHAHKISKKWRDVLSRQEEKRGLLIAFEGPDGAGKTTQQRLLMSWLESQGREVVVSKWNSSPLVKPLFKTRRKARSLSPEEMCLLRAADYRYRLEHQIVPALWEGKMVIAEPYLFTAMALDSARGVPLHWLLTTYTPLFWPDVTFYFSVSVETSRKRIAAKKAPKFYTAGQDFTRIEDPLESYRQFTKRVIEEYDALGLVFRFTQVDAEQSIYNQHRAIRNQLQQSERRPWIEWNAEALVDWLERRPKAVETPAEVA